MIPTKNRYETLLPVLEAFIKNIEGNNYEIVVQDNSDNNKPFLDWSQNFHDEKIKYFYEPQKLDIIQNTTKALEHCNGEYLIFIGDDDFVSPYIVQITEFVKGKNIDCLIYSPGHYWWNSVIFAKERDYLKKQTYWLPLNINTELIRMDSMTEINKTLDQGGNYYYKLPRFYHGLIKRKILNAIKTKIGIYLPGICPDIGFSMSIALIIDDYYFINYPVSVFGASKNSGAGWGSNNTHYGKIEDVSFLPENTNEKWDSLLPKIWSAYTTNAQTVYDVFKTFHLNREINYEEFYASMYANESVLERYIRPVVKEYCKKNIIKYFNVYRKFIPKFLKKLMIGFVHNLRYKTGRFKFKILQNIKVEDVMPILSEISFDFYNKL
jgi:hypothetical protein